MSRVENILEALSLYKKHGWTLRRVLLSEESRRDLGSSAQELFGPARIVGFGKDAAWFSRASGKDREAWELRLFGDAPFALVEVFEADQDEESRNEIRSELEQRILEPREPIESGESGESGESKESSGPIESKVPNA